jgi:hypothetical protein
MMDPPPVRTAPALIDLSKPVRTISSLMSEKISSAVAG